MATKVLGWSSRYYRGSTQTFPWVNLGHDVLKHFFHPPPHIEKEQFKIRFGEFYFEIVFPNRIRQSNIEDNQIVMGYPAIPLKEFIKKSKKDSDND